MAEKEKLVRFGAEIFDTKQDRCYSGDKKGLVIWDDLVPSRVHRAHLCTYKTHRDGLQRGKTIFG